MYSHKRSPWKGSRQSKIGQKEKLNYLTRTASANPMKSKESLGTGGESLLEGHDLGQGASLKLRESLKKMTVRAYLLIALPVARGPSPSFMGDMGKPLHGYYALMAV